MSFDFRVPDLETFCRQFKSKLTGKLTEMAFPLLLIGLCTTGSAKKERKKKKKKKKSK